MKKNKLNLIHLSFTIVTILLVLFIIGSLVGILLKPIDCFKIKDIIVRDNQEIDGSTSSFDKLRTSPERSRGTLTINPELSRRVDLSYLKGKNIFIVDLKKESEYIAKYYPTYRKIRLARVLPNRIFVDFIGRQPLALVKLYRQFLVDEEGVLFDVSEQRKDEDLPLILGLETKIFGPKVGRQYNIKELDLALNIIKELNLNRVFKNYKITKINVANIANTSFFINELEVKLGQEQIKNKINILASLLIQLKNDLANIKYIDLRFKEPVMKFKDVK